MLRFVPPFLPLLSITKGADRLDALSDAASDSFWAFSSTLRVCSQFKRMNLGFSFLLVLEIFTKSVPLVGSSHWASVMHSIELTTDGPLFSFSLRITSVPGAARTSQVVKVKGHAAALMVRQVW